MTKVSRYGQMVTVVLICAGVFVFPHLHLTRTYAQDPGTGKIAFSSLRDGNWDVYTMNPDGTDLQRITDHPADDHSADWSPTRDQFVFMSTRDGDEEVYTMDIIGNNITRITYSPGIDDAPTWSPDGTTITWSSLRDGNYEIYAMDPYGNNPTNLTEAPDSYDYRPHWKPDGTKIVFVSDRDGNLELYMMDPDGSNQTRLTYDPADDYAPDWSPDGTKIVFDSDRDGDSEIYVADFDGSTLTNITNLTDHPASDKHPVWSPDGSQISFQSDRAGDWEIFTMNIDGTNQTNRTNDLGNDQIPMWDLIPPIGCFSDAPVDVFQGDTFTLTLECVGITENVFGFQAGHAITAGDTLVTAQAAIYTEGTIFQGQPTLTGENTLPLYALSLQAGGTEATGDFTLGSVDYSADFPGQTTFDLINLILGNINGEAIADVQASPSTATVTIIDLILSLTGTVDPEGVVSDTELELTLEGTPDYADLTKTLNPDGTIDFTYTNIKGQPDWLQADGPSHLSCEETLTFPADAGDESVPTLILRAGDVDNDDSIDVADSTAIGLAYGLPASGELDINGDGTINILDLIHVGRNYGTVGPTDCTP